VLQGAWFVLAAQEPSSDPAELLRLGRQSYSRGDHPGAASALERAWRLLETRPSDDPLRYDTARMMATVYSVSGRLADAENFLQTAIRLRENALGPQHPKVAEDLLSLAVLYQRSKEFGKGLRVMDRVRNIHIRDGGHQNPLLEDDFSFTARLLMGSKEIEQAAALLQVAIDRRSARLGPDHPALLPDLDRLGAAQISLRQYDKAEETYRAALNLRERWAGDNDPDLIQTLDGLGYACFGQKKYEQAETLYRRLLSVWVASAGPEHPMVALTLDKLAVLLRERKMLREAREPARRSTAIRALFLAGSLAGEGDFASLQGDKKEAARFYRQALAALDPARAEHQELRRQLQRNLRELAALLPAARKSRGSPAKDTASSTGRK
jgi:tetratricopeptide (TPR) repeat protein